MDAKTCLSFLRKMLWRILGPNTSDERLEKIAQ
jgi:hypothetical protein